MPRKRHHKPLLLTEDERRTLEQWARRPKSAQRLALRARIVLACDTGLPNRAVAAHRDGWSSRSSGTLELGFERFFGVHQQRQQPAEDIHAAADEQRRLP